MSKNGNENGVSVGSMRFDVVCVKDFLVKNGFVYTVRGYKMRNMLVNVDGVGICKRARGISRNGNDDRIKSKEELRDWVKGSGFSSVDSWWNAIYKFCKDRDKWVYLVKVVK